MIRWAAPTTTFLQSWHSVNDSSFSFSLVKRQYFLKKKDSRRDLLVFLLRGHRKKNLFCTSRSSLEL